MKARGLANLILAAVTLMVCCAPCTAQTTVSSSNPIRFGDHDIGTITLPQTVVVTNGSDGPVDLSVKISEGNWGDFPWNSTCLNTLPPKSKCEITVQFRPTAVAKDESGKPTESKSTLTISDGKGTPQTVTLQGKAFENVGVSPGIIEFENQVGTSSTARTVQLTNYTSSAVNSITVTATGDFTENHSGCSTPIAPGGSCAITVTYSPKQAGDTSGSLTITTNPSNLGKLPRVVLLHGGGLIRCKLPPFSWRDRGLRLVLFVSGLYFLGLVLVRWHMIAKPARAQLVAEIEAVRSRVNAEAPRLSRHPELNERIDRIQDLLDQALYPFKHPRFPFPSGSGWTRRNQQDYQEARRPSPRWWTRFSDALFSRDHEPTWHEYPWCPTRFFNALFWTRGQELAGWSLAHEAEIQLAGLLPLERVRARLETAEQELRDINTPLALALADRIGQSLTSEEGLLQDRSRQLLQEELGLLRSVSAKEAAREAVLADSRKRAQTFLEGIAEWTENNTSAAANADDCKSRLQQFLKICDGSEDLRNELDQMANLAWIPAGPRDVFQRIAGFLKQRLDPLRQDILQASGDPALPLEDCNKAVATLAPLGLQAAGLVDELKKTPPLDQACQHFLDLSQSQGALLETIKQAVTPSSDIALLQEILNSLQGQAELIQKINQAAAGSPQTMESCRSIRPLLLQLASAPPLSADLIDKINFALSAESLAPLRRWRALLAEALGLIYDNTDSDFFGLASWHNKMMWLVGCALLFMFALAVSLGNAVLLLLGAVGGLLSRLTRTATAAEVANDYGATWGSLFLSPLTGALSAWGGILLIILGLKFNIFGTALNVDWCNPYDPVALALAFLFGFSERLFDTLSGQLQNKLLKPPSAPPTSAPSTSGPAPTITSMSPGSATIGKEVQLTVRGANFQSGATASVTDDVGKAASAKLEFKDATTVVVTCTPSGAKAFSATLSITNPDKQSTTSKFDVAAAP